MADQRAARRPPMGRRHGCDLTDGTRVANARVTNGVVTNALYNARRPHSSLADRTPDEAYFFPLPLAAAASPARVSRYPTSLRCTEKRSHFTHGWLEEVQVNQ